MSDDNDDDDYDGQGWAKLAGWLIDEGNFQPGISKCLPGRAELCSLIDSLERITLGDVYLQVAVGLSCLHHHHQYLHPHYFLCICSHSTCVPLLMRCSSLSHLCPSYPLAPSHVHDESNVCRLNRYTLVHNRAATNSFIIH